MCQPAHFFDQEVPYTINAWMRKGMPVSRETAMHQWNRLKWAISQVLPVDVMQPRKKCPDMTFVDQGLALPSQVGDAPIFIPSLLQEAVRRPEVKGAIEFFKERGYSVLDLDSALARKATASFEANGDVHIVPGHPLLFVGHGRRTSTNILAPLEELTGHQIIPIYMGQKTRSYHLDTASSIISPETAIIYPQGLSPDGFILFCLFFNNVYLVNAREAREEFVPNSKQVGQTFFTQTSVNEHFLHFLDTRPPEEIIEVVEVDMSELNKSGGGINCCSKLAFHIPPS